MPAPIEAAILKAMAADPGRPVRDSTAEFALALEEGASARPRAPVGRRAPRARCVALGLLRARRGLVVAGGSARGGAEETATARLAVLPFENVGDADDAYFADGVADAVRGKLSALPGLQVIASSSSDQYRQTSKSPQDIGRELGARVPAGRQGALAEGRRVEPACR